MLSQSGEYGIERVEEYMGIPSSEVLTRMFKAPSYNLFAKQYGHDEDSFLNDIVNQLLYTTDREERIVNIPRLITGLFKIPGNYGFIQKTDYVNTVRFCKEIFMTAVNGTHEQFVNQFKGGSELVRSILSCNPLVKKADNLSLAANMTTLENLNDFEASYGEIKPEDIVITLANGANLLGLIMSTQRRFNWLPARFSMHKEHDISPVLYDGALVDIFEHMMFNSKARIIVWDEDTTEAVGLIRTKRYLKQCIGKYYPILIFTNSGNSVADQNIKDENEIEI